ncbi:MAG: hypothetical protein QMC96_06485 [Methanomicrobiales archaeon]|nr:hypothetical protein [Methanomicrobiales archaeon]
MLDLSDSGSATRKSSSQEYTPALEILIKVDGFPVFPGKGARLSNPFGG